MDLLKRARSYTTPDGVTIWMLPYVTALANRLHLTVRDQMGDDLPDSLVVFCLCAALTIKIDLPPENSPEWALVLSEFMADTSFFVHPVEKAQDLERAAPNELYKHWYSAYQATRPVELMAVPELQEAAPDPVSDDDDETKKKRSRRGGKS